MNEQDIEINYYDYDRHIKIDRFFEVAEYLTKNDLWGEVGVVMKDNPLIGNRIKIDMHLANAAKIVLMKHASKSGTITTDRIVIDALRCATMQEKSDPDDTTEQA